MRIPLEWLKEYIDYKGSARELAELLTMSGTETEVISDAKDFDPNIIVGEIIEINPHPNADRLRIPKVKISEEKTLDIVCGASNIEIGQKVPVALVGAKLGEFEIKEAEIRGVKSLGMICSEQELGIAEHSEGIMILETDAPVGKKLGEILSKNKDILDAELTPNRGDCFSIIGIAREVAAIENQKLKKTETKIQESKEDIEKYLKVTVNEKELCPRYSARLIKIKNNPESPKWMQEKLIDSGVRPINAVVDVTNYAMLEMGQPLHAFDMQKLKSGEIVVRKAKEGEIIETLDKVKRKLKKDDLVITDGENPIAIAGVMGGKSIEVDKNTKTIILESATFDKTTVRKTAQRLGLRSESSNRFEKGIPMPLNPLALDRAASLIAELCGGEILKNQIDILNKWIWVQHIGIKISEIARFFGKNLSEKEIIENLERLGFEAEKYDIAKEAKKHLGKPYIFGAKFKTHGTNAFDCSYLTDYIYSLIGHDIGHMAIDQFDKGIEVKEKDLKPGDLLFYIGRNAPKNKKYPKGVGHVGIYIGENKVIDCVRLEYDNKTKKYIEKGHQAVHEQSADVFLKNPEYLGARRYAEDLDDYIAVTVPWWRLDVSIKEDLYEEIARIYGYNNFPSTLPTGEIPVDMTDPIFDLSARLKHYFKGIGFTEVYNYSFVSSDWLKNLSLETKKSVQVANPLNSELEYMRTSLVPSILSNTAKNQVNFPESSIFEIARIYENVGLELPKETLHLSGAVMGGESRGIKYKEGKEFFIAKGALEGFIKGLGVVNLERSKMEFLHPGRSADILADGKVIGYFGEVKNDVLKKFDIKKRVAVFDIDLEKVIKIEGKIKQYMTFNRLPEVVRDLAFLLDKEVEVREIIRSVQSIKSDIVKDSSIKDIYEGKELGEGKKSILVNVIYQHKERTLKDEEVKAVENEIIEKIKRELNGILRA